MPCEFQEMGLEELRNNLQPGWGKSLLALGQQMGLRVVTVGVCLRKYFCN